MPTYICNHELIIHSSIDEIYSNAEQKRMNVPAYVRMYDLNIWICCSSINTWNIRSCRQIATQLANSSFFLFLSQLQCSFCPVWLPRQWHNDALKKKKEEKILSYWHYTCTRSQVQSLIVAKKLTRKLLPTIRFSSICYHRHNQGDLFFSEHFKKILDVSTDVTGRQGNERDGISSL